LKGLILCGGMDTRLYPITYTIPKQLIPIANKPLIVYAIDLLLKSGIDELGIIVNKYNKPIFEKILNKYYTKDFHYIIQHDPKGIAHGLLFAEEYINKEKFIMVLGDNSFNFDLQSFIIDFQTSKKNCKILLKEVNDPEGFRVAYIGNEKIIDLEEKPKTAFSNYAITGIYAFDENIFKAAKNIKPYHRGEHELTDAIKWLLQNGYDIDYQILKEKWRDIGNPIDVIEENIDILSSMEENITGEVVNSHISGKIILGKDSAIYNSIVRGPVIIGDNSIIKHSYIGPYTSIGIGVNIHKSNVENSIVLDGCTIQEVRTPIDSSIIGEGSRIGYARSLKEKNTIIVGRNSKIYLQK